MFFKRQIKGKIVECAIRREYMLPMRFARSCRDYDFDFDYEYFEETDTRCNYYFEYQMLVVKFDFCGKEKLIKFDNITLHNFYKVSDSIVVIYNKLDKTFKLKD